MPGGRGPSLLPGVPCSRKTGRPLGFPETSTDICLPSASHTVSVTFGLPRIAARGAGGRLSPESPRLRRTRQCWLLLFMGVTRQALCRQRVLSPMLGRSPTAGATGHGGGSRPAPIVYPPRAPALQGGGPGSNPVRGPDVIPPAEH